MQNWGGVGYVDLYYMTCDDGYSNIGGVSEIRIAEGQSYRAGAAGPSSGAEATGTSGRGNSRGVGQNGGAHFGGPSGGEGVAEPSGLRDEDEERDDENKGEGDALSGVKFLSDNDDQEANEARMALRDFHKLKYVNWERARKVEGQGLGEREGDIEDDVETDYFASDEDEKYDSSNGSDGNIAKRRKSRIPTHDPRSQVPKFCLGLVFADKE